MGQFSMEKPVAPGSALSGNQQAEGLLMTEASAESVKIGVLNDQSGVYADFSGKGSVEGAKMAIG